MTLKDLGEFGLIRRYIPLFSKHIPHNVEGIGNDCAVIPFSDTQSLLVTTDLLVENTHFIKGQIPAEDLGYKSLSVNLSDIAAMGGRPRYAFLSVAFPVETPLAWIDGYMASFGQLAEESGVLLLGGDTTRSAFVAINVLIIGEIETSTIKRRSQALPGDIICCTGYLGDSGGGLKILLEGLSQESEAQELIHAHFRPRPQLEEGVWLAKQPGIHAMMDISDGLASDMQRIMEESHCGAHIEVEKLPLSESLRKASARFHWCPEDLALTAGEDYCLLFTIDPRHYDTLKNTYYNRFNRPLYRIGTILPEANLLYTFNSQIYIPAGSGFDHFKT